MRARIKKLTAILCVAALGAGLLAGCGSASSEEAVISADAEADEDEGFDDEDIVDISVTLLSIGEKSGDQEVIDAVNEISREEIGVEIDVEWIDIGNWVEQMNLKLSSAESTDIIMVTPLMTLSSLLAQNSLMDITDYLDEYGQDIESLLPEEYLEAATVDGEVYAIPMLMPKQNSYYVAMRTDILDELGLTEQAEAISSWSDLEEILTAVRDNTDLVPLYCAVNSNTGVTIPDYFDLTEDAWSEASGLDSLGDPYGLIYVDEETNTICSYYQSDIFRTDMERAADYYSKGYLYADGATTDTEAEDAMASDVSFAHLYGTEDLGALTQEELRTGYDLTLVKVVPESITSNLITMWSYAIPYTANEPEAAMEFLNLLYTNEEMANLFRWGIEGRDYTLNDDGTATAIENAPYASEPWIHGNYLLMYPADSNGADYNEEMAELLGEQTYSNYLGFNCDTSEVTNELTSCYTAMQEYGYSLLAGSRSDYETAYEEFMDKLESGGIDAVVACYQEQLDAWLAEQ